MIPVDSDKSRRGCYQKSTDKGTWDMDTLLVSKTVGGDPQMGASRPPVHAQNRVKTSI